MDKFTKKILKNEGIWTVFYSDWCGYSKRALEYMKRNEIPFKGYKIDKINGGMDRLLKCLGDTCDITGFDTSHRTRPIIFNNGKFVGGYTEMVAFIQK